MSEKSDDKVLEVKKFNYYIVFMDTNGIYLTAYGYDEKPVIMNFFVAVKQLSEEKDLAAAIPNFHEVIDYVGFEIMEYDDFIKYLDKDQQENKKG